MTRYARPVTEEAITEAEAAYRAASAAEDAHPLFAPGGMKLAMDRQYKSDYLDLLRRWYAQEHANANPAQAQA